MMHEVVELLPVLAPAVVARLKILAGMDIAVHRNPQDGRFSATINGNSLDVRTSTYPTIWGEKAVLRLLDRSSLHRSVSNVMSGRALQTFRDLIRRSEGFVVVTGPTGSGKTSTLYAALGELAESGKNVVTIEDPVEYWLPGVSQGQTNNKAGFTFALGLRAILRQDPDVIMVGEIRDPETLNTAIEASLTGHLVLSTLHTNGSVATLTRLLEMGVEPYLLASAMAGVIAQRLVRKTCESCKRRDRGSRTVENAVRRQPARDHLPRRRLHGVSRHWLSRPDRRVRAATDERGAAPPAQRTSGRGRDPWPLRVGQACRR